ncbi:MAG: hypothetical protein H6739_01510 [Alphaproteobacteria bacterium]|nr:hypothetical protein [Alphaproteobacteria bacterium]
MTRTLTATCGLAVLVGCQMAADPTIGTINVKNADATKWSLLITNDEACTIGLRTSINQNTQTTFDVDKTLDSFVCVDEKKPAIKVNAGESYEIRGGRIARQ